ncbi:nucleoside phosphorylase [Micromonospora echinospora]|uniref:Nucleoside phosphorylase n=1 Tax=Micromonospora echinospora TaxID=1877 RepID=A0ABR6MAY1_MICEC|nr:5'-methylthioadenosine/S-adenosylhomocysteine nucleosidase [Micromonospora echinospora]MBB5112530.1 nucleoside phosphorylase [Micromonospora echinospora]
MITTQPVAEWRSSPPSYRDCRAAARSIRGAEFGRDAMDLVRPRSVLGVFRGKAPLPMVLYVAGHEGRLVWRNPDSLAMLQPPADHAVAPLAGRLRVARGLVRHWDAVLLTAPPVVCLLGALVVALTGALLGPAFVLVASLALALVAVGYIALLMTALVLYAARSVLGAVRNPRPAPGAVAARTLPGTRWSMVLCHHVDPATGGELLSHVTARLSHLITGQAKRCLQELGAQAPIINVTETLVCLTQGITSSPMRRRAAAWSTGSVAAGSDPEAMVKRPLRQPDRPPLRLFDTGTVALLYLVAVAVVVLGEAVLIAGWEREECAQADCAGRPANYGSAVRWLAQRLLFNDPPSITPATAQSVIVGWLTSVMSAVGVVVLAVALYRYARHRSSNARELRAMINERRSVVLILVATRTERDAFFAALKAANGREPEPQPLNTHVVFDLGVVSRAQVVLAQSGPGAVDPGGAAITAAALIQRLAPDFLILAGICFGLREDEQSLGDIVVSRKLRAIDHRKVMEPEPGQPPIIRIRGDFVSSSEALYQRFGASEYTWTRCPVHFGTILSSSTLVNSRQLHRELQEIDPEAIAGEMEGAGVYAAAAPEKVDWIVVKAIADRGYDKSDDMQPLAARNAADFVVHTLRSGAMDERIVTATAS